MVSNSVVSAVAWHVTATGGFDSAWIRVDGDRFAAHGRAIGQLAELYWLDYTVETVADFVTSQLRATVEVDGAARQLDLRRDRNGWTVDGTPRDDLADALDCDLGFCPVTNTMPILRHGLHLWPGRVTFTMAFVQVPSLQVVPSVQQYEFIDRADGVAIVRYSSGSFSSDLRIDAHGIVLDYPSLATRLPPASAPAAAPRGPSR